MNLVFEFGMVSPKEAQDLARHSTPDLTFNVYGRSRKERLSEAVERLAAAILPAESVPGECRLAVGAETESVTYFNNKKLRSLKDGSGGRTRTHTPTQDLPDTSDTETAQNPAKSIHSNALAIPSGTDAKQKHALSEHNLYISEHSKGVPGEYQIPDDLAEVIAAWPDLAPEIKAEILARIRTG